MEEYHDTPNARLRRSHDVGRNLSYIFPNLEERSSEKLAGQRKVLPINEQALFVVTRTVDAEGLPTGRFHLYSDPSLPEDLCDNTRSKTTGRWTHTSFPSVIMRSLKVSQRCSTEPGYEQTRDTR